MSAVAGYGTWRSPITAEAITAGQVGLGQPRLDGGSAYWLEARPQEGGPDRARPARAGRTSGRM